MNFLRSHLRAPAWFALGVAAFVACSPKDPVSSDDDGDGGATGGTGAVATGGTSGTSGAATGGSVTGGAPSGGAAGLGGSILAGASGTGFSGGTSGASSGAAGTGGTAPSGGSGGSILGGAGGVGGTVPQGGAGGSGAGTGGTPGGGSGGKATGFLVEDFESATAGMPLAGWDTFIAYQKNGPNPSGTALALVDATRAHSGTKSIHFHGGQSPAMITKPLPANTTRLYVRAWFYNSRQLGMVPNANHETLIGIRKTSGNANDEVRFGEIKGVIGTNEVPTDNISPKMDRWGMGPVIPANAWACIEVAFLGDLPTHELKAWHNGTLVHEVTSSGADQWQNGAMPSATWMTGKFNEVILGWQSFTGGQAEVDLWMDDLILSNSSIGCN